MLRGGGQFSLKPGEWTDDTSMALCLAQSLVAKRGLDERDVMERFVRWWRYGENSVTGHCFDIGNATAGALQHFVQDGNPIAGSTSPRVAGNGSLMRLSPVAVAAGSRELAVDWARRQSVTTHGSATCVEACAWFAGLLWDAIGGMDKQTLLQPGEWQGTAEIAAIASGGWRGKSRAQISSSGYVVHTLEAAVWCVDQAHSFDEAVLLAANLGDDADTVAAVTGQLAGAVWGLSAIPPSWMEVLAWRSKLQATAQSLLAVRQAPSEP